MARGNRAILLSEQAQETTDPAARLRLLNQAIAEERESLALDAATRPARLDRHQPQQSGGPAAATGGGRWHGLQGVDEPDHRQDAGATATHGQDARATLLDEAEQHALQALAIRERLNSPDTWQTLLVLERIAEARGDAAAAAEYRRRKEAAHAEAQQRAGRQGLPPQTIVALLQLALTARAQRLDFADALRSAGADDPAALLAAIQQTDPWLAAHLSALATGQPRPAAEPPAIPGPLVPSLVRRHRLKPEARASGEPSRPFHWRIGFPSRCRLRFPSATSPVARLSADGTCGIETQGSFCDILT